MVWDAPKYPVTRHYVVCKSLPQQYLSTKVVEKGAESVLHKILIVGGNLRELNHYALSVLPSSHKGIGVDC